jgi:hypothetical protein
MMDAINLHWQGPFSFFPNEADPCLFDDSIADRQGLYLWTLSTPAGAKVAYVGKAGGSGKKSSFASRLRPELIEALTAKYQQLLNLDLWRKGHRFVEKDYGRYDASLYQPALEAIRRSCRAYLAVIDAEDRVLKSIEELLIRRLTDFHSCDKLPQGCSPFLSNRYRGGVVPNLEVRSEGDGILGLSGVTLGNQLSGSV